MISYSLASKSKAFNFHFKALYELLKSRIRLIQFAQLPLNTPQPPPESKFPSSHISSPYSRPNASPHAVFPVWNGYIPSLQILDSNQSPFQNFLFSNKLSLKELIPQ